ncbi:MAG: hypothetical protein IIW56_02870 [Oscillospiraceae bacterium]|nr:hypothetical protein [Oscillospiraceae bacterium]
MFDYTVCTQADVELFHKQCAAIEKNIPNLKKHDLLEDVDGTLSQRYDHDRGQIVVKNDVQVDALYVTADFDLLPYFN